MWREKLLPDSNISILVPCHRIVGARGAVGGYAGGVARKLELLALEGVLLRGE